MPDINQDGIDEILIGAPMAKTAGKIESGRVQLHSGMDGRFMRYLNGDTQGQQLGYCVLSAGDLDGDGIPDFVASAPFQWSTRQKRGVIIGFSVGAQDYIFRAQDVDDLLGIDLYSLGDEDGDGVADIWARTSSQTFVLSGASGAVRAWWDRTSHTHAGVRIDDLNGDGLDDRLAADPFDQPPWSSIQGHGSVTALDGRDMTHELLPRAYGSYAANFGRFMGPVGDLDGDGIDEFIATSYAGAGGRPPELILASFRRYLDLFPKGISLPLGGSAQFSMSFGPEFAGAEWHLFGSSLGTGPSRRFGVDIPLVAGDFLWNALVSATPPPQFSAVNGNLDASGKAIVALTIQPGSWQRFGGQHFWFAAVASTTPGKVERISIPVQLFLGG